MAELLLKVEYVRQWWESGKRSVLNSGWQQTFSKQMMNRVTWMTTSWSAAHLGIPRSFEVILSVSVGHWRKWFLWFFSWGRLSHHQPSTILHFDVIFFIFLNWAAAILWVFCWKCVRDCPHQCLMYFPCFLFCFFSCFSSILFSSTCLNHLAPYRSYVPNRWLKFLFFKGGGASYVLRCLIGWKLWLQALAVTLRQQSNFSAWHSLCGDNIPPYQI